MNSAEVEARLTESIRQLILQQWQLAELDVGERSVTSHLFRYVADAFSETGYDVDHEYNRRGSLTKYLSYTTGDDEGVRRMYPDIVVHRRNRDDANLVAIEVKKGAANDSNDHQKIRGLVSEDGYRYRWGILLALGMNSGAWTGIWAPRWEWLVLNPETWEMVTLSNGIVFPDDELELINMKGSESSTGG